MPFPIVFGIPEYTPMADLIELRRSIVASLAEALGCDASWIRPLFPRDLLPDALTAADGGETIYVRLDTAMFNGKEADDESVPLGVISTLARVVWNAFGGAYEVKVFVGDLNPSWKILIKAKS